MYNQAEIEMFRAAVAAIESAAAAHAIGEFPTIRAKIKGLSRVRKSIFYTGPDAKNWDFAIHWGGRGELQLNVGLERTEEGLAFRTGVAFSIEPSRSFPDVSVLYPSIGLFNHYVREHPTEFADMSMWYWRGGQKSLSFPPTQIPDSLAKPKTFIFLGTLQQIDSFHVEASMVTLDRLIPLYRWVEGNRAGISEGTFQVTSGSPNTPPDALDLSSGVDIDGGAWISASYSRRTIDVFLRQREIQRQLKELLLSEGWEQVLLEARIGARAVDAVALRAKEMWFFEVKTAPSVRACIREAVGQLLEYALWPGATAPTRLVVVGEPSLGPDARAYLNQLNQRFPIPIEYRQVSLNEA